MAMLYLEISASYRTAPKKGLTCQDAVLVLYIVTFTAHALVIIN